MRAYEFAILLVIAPICRGQAPHVGAIDGLVQASAASQNEQRGFERIVLAHGHAIVAYPQNHQPHTPYPLLIALHGTDTNAYEIIAFWQAVGGPLSMILLAPQSGAAGWRESDTALLADVEAYVAVEPSFDRTRVFLAGHSAGGAMALHWALAMGFAANGVVTTANYVPPTVTPDRAAARSNVPIFCAVGTLDLNHARMRSGARMLRSADIDLTLHEPAIGHRLDDDVARSAMRWIEQQARDIVDTGLSTAQADLRSDFAPGVAVAFIETIIADADAHVADQVTRAVALREKALAAAQARLQAAFGLAERGAPLAARQRLLDLERMYASSSIAAEARRLRVEIEAHPKVAGMLLHAVDVEIHESREAIELRGERPTVLAGR